MKDRRTTKTTTKPDWLYFPDSGAGGTESVPVAAGATLLYLLAGRRILRKTGFYGAVVAVVMFIIAFCFSAVRPPVEAIVMSEAATVKSAPDAAARDAFILYEGTKVQIVSTLGVWSEIEIADGNKGWIASAAIETIH